MARKSGLTEKDMAVLREGMSTRETFTVKRATIRDYSLRHRVVVEWDLNDEAERDKIFRLSIDGVDVLIDAEEIMRLIRWV